MTECYNNVRFSLSDSSGHLRFESFDIVDMPQCGDLAAALKKHLVGRTLAQVDVERIRAMKCPGEPTCVAEVARIVEEQQRLFAAAPPMST